MKSLLGEDSLTAFDAKITKLCTNPDMNTTQNLTSKMVEMGLNAVVLTVFPHRALFRQKTWMRRHLRMPNDWMFCKTSSAVMQLNNCLRLFPGATNEDKFSEGELIEKVEFSVPVTWRAEFDKRGHGPMDHDQARLITESEIVERTLKNPTEGERHTGSKGKSNGITRKIDKSVHKSQTMPNSVPNKPSNNANCIG